MTTDHQPQSQTRQHRPHARCAWCRNDFSTIVELLDHVDQGHLSTQSAA